MSLLTKASLSITRRWAGRHFQSKAPSSIVGVTATDGNSGWFVALGVLGAVTIASTTTSSSRSSPSPLSTSAVSCQAQAVVLDTATVHKKQLQPKKKKKEQHSSNQFRLEDAYEIEKILGEGGYGMVFQARRKTDGAAVALKTMPREFTGKTDFEREVAALQLLSKTPHPHVVQLYDLHRDDENYFLVMELIQGEELLEHLIQHGPYSEGTAASFIRQFAEGISYVHSNGLVHSDLKPENLLLANPNDDDQDNMANATLKLVDFGSARTHDLSRKDMQLPAEEFARGCSFLHMVALGNQFELQKMLQDRPLLCNFRDYDFRTPLHLAASEGHVDICRFLVEKGAKLNRMDRWGGTPLDDAHRHRHSHVIEYLREQGATFGKQHNNSQSQFTPRFIQAAAEGDKEEVQALLEYGNHLDYLDQGDYDSRTAIHLSAGEGRIEIVEMLCQAGANVNVEDRWGNRPLDDALNAKKNKDDVIQILIEYGAASVKNPSANHILLKKKDKHNHPYPSKKITGKPSPQKKDNEDENFTGTIAYQPPELFTPGATPSPATDCWAAGVIMYILLTGTHPFDKNADLTDEQMQESIVKVGHDKENSARLMNEIVFDERIEGLSDSCIELMRVLMHPDPQKRMASEEFLRHPWTQGLTASMTTMANTHQELKSFWQNRFRLEIMNKFAAILGNISDNKQPSEEDLTEVFQALDLKRNGVLDLDEIQEAFRGLGISEQNVRTLFACVDLDGTGVIHFDEFKTLLNPQSKDSSSSSSSSSNDNSSEGRGLHVNYLQQRFKTHVSKRLQSNDATKTTTLTKPDKNKLREVFNSIDLKGNGVLDAHDVRMFLRSAGEPEDVISRIFASLDISGGGRVSWDDFLSIMGMTSE